MAEQRSTMVSRWAATLIPYLWLLVFFFAPFLIVLKISFSTYAISIPPYEPVFNRLADIPENVRQLTLANYELIVGDSLYLGAYTSSLTIAAISTAVTLSVGYPLAYAIARAPSGLRTVLVIAVIVPFWTSLLIRVYAWIAILKNEGLLNQGLLALGLINEPLTLLNTNTAVIIGIVYSYLPFMVLPLYAALERQEPALLEAAADLGATPLSAFWRVTFPLSLPGIAAGTLLVFIPAVGEFVIPDLLGGSETLMIGKTLWAEFFNNRDWPVAAAVAILVLLALVVPIVLFERLQSRGEAAL